MDSYLQIIYGVHHLRAAPAALCFGWMSSPSYHIRFIKVPLCLAISRSFLDVGGPVRKRYIMSFTVAPPCWRSMVAVHVCVCTREDDVNAHSLQLYSNIYILINHFAPSFPHTAADQPEHGLCPNGLDIEFPRGELPKVFGPRAKLHIRQQFR